MNYNNYLIEKGSALNSQISHLKALYYYARYLEDKNIIDVKEKHEVIVYLNSKIKNDDMEKKYLGTWNDYMLKLRTFYRWIYNSDDESKGLEYWTTPDFIKIKKKPTKRISPYMANEIWEKDELQIIIKYEISRRNKAIIALLWDLDARPHEVTLLKIKHIRLKAKYGEGEIPFNAKTGSGPILLTFSFPYIRDWLNEHPDRNNTEARLICTLRNGSPLDTGIIYYIMAHLKKRIQRLVISGSITDQREKERLEYFLNTKKWNPYCIRHSAITADSDYLPEYALKKKVTLSMNSNQGRRYIKNRMGDELRNKILEQNGIIIDTDLKPKPTIAVCPRCELVNQIENKYCSKCSYPLTPQAFEEIKNEEDSKLKALEEKQNKQMEDMQAKLQKIMENVDFNKIKQ
jgi:integrase